MVARNIFDQLAEEDYGVFDAIEQETSSIDRIKSELSALLDSFDQKDRKAANGKITDEVKSFIQAEIAKIKPVQSVIEKTIQTVIRPKVFHVEPKIIEAPPQIIKEVRVEVQTEKKDTRKYVEESKYLDLLVKVSRLENQLKETRRMAESPIVVGGPGVIGIPPPEPNPDNYVLTVAQGKAKWKPSTGSGGSSSDVYTTSNVTTKRTLDPTTSTIDDLYNTVASLIVSLQGAGIIQ